MQAVEGQRTSNGTKGRGAVERPQATNVGERGDQYELDPMQRMAIDRIAKEHGFTIRQSVTFAVSAGSFLSDQVTIGKEVAIGRRGVDVEGLIDTIKRTG